MVEEYYAGLPTDFTLLCKIKSRREVESSSRMDWVFTGNIKYLGASV